MKNVFRIYIKKLTIVTTCWVYLFTVSLPLFAERVYAAEEFQLKSTEVSINNYMINAKVHSKNNQKPSKHSNSKKSIKPKSKKSSKQKNTNVLKEASNLKPPYVNARSSVAIDVKTKAVLFEQNAEEIVAIASTTKILTCLVAIKYGDLDKKVIISDKAAKIHGSTVGYKAGESISIRELLYGLMLRSGNDAAIAVAEGVSGSVEEFVNLMNEYALHIGVLNSHFDVPHGLDNATHYSSAYDLAIITAKAKEEPDFNRIVSCKEALAQELGFTRSYRNINKILWLLPNADGVKTGYTGDAGKCLVTSIKLDNKDIVIVVLNSNGRWKETSKIANYIENSYSYEKLFSKDQVIKTYINEKLKKSLEMIVKDDIIVPIKKNSNYEIKIHENKNLTLPIEKNDAIGNFEVIQDEKIIYRGNIYSKNKLSTRGF